MTKWLLTHTDYSNGHNHIAFPLLPHHCFLFVLLLYSPFFLLSAKWYHKNLNYYLEPFLPPSDRLSFISVKFANSVQLKFLPGSILPLFDFLLKTHCPQPPPMFFSASLPRCWVHYTLIRSRVLFFSFFNPVILASCNTSSFRWNHLSTVSLPRSHKKFSLLSVIQFLWC